MDYGLSNGIGTEDPEKEKIESWTMRSSHGHREGMDRVRCKRDLEEQCCRHVYTQLLISSLHRFCGFCHASEVKAPVNVVHSAGPSDQNLSF